MCIIDCICCCNQNVFIHWTVSGPTQLDTPALWWCGLGCQSLLNAALNISIDYHSQPLTVKRIGSIDHWRRLLSPIMVAAQITVSNKSLCLLSEKRSFIFVDMSIMFLLMHNLRITISEALRAQGLSVSLSQVAIFIRWSRARELECKAYTVKLHIRICEDSAILQNKSPSSLNSFVLFLYSGSLAHCLGTSVVPILWYKSPLKTCDHANKSFVFKSALLSVDMASDRRLLGLMRTWIM